MTPPPSQACSFSSLSRWFTWRRQSRVPAMAWPVRISLVLLLSVHGMFGGPFAAADEAGGYLCYVNVADTHVGIGRNPPAKYCQHQFEPGTHPFSIRWEMSAVAELTLRVISTTDGTGIIAVQCIIRGPISDCRTFDADGGTVLVDAAGPTLLEGTLDLAEEGDLLLTIEGWVEPVTLVRFRSGAVEALICSRMC